MSSDFPRFPTRLLIMFPTGFHGRKSRKPPILHSAKSDSEISELIGGGYSDIMQCAQITDNAW